MQERIVYLKQEEKENTRQMYERIFPEDSKTFVDYYYQWKIRDNDILVMKDAAGFEVMLHLNPYQLVINGKSAEAPYIVAVATREDCRRKGKMQQVMKQVLQDLRKKQIPFTFLLPANPNYYCGQGFVFVPELPLKKKAAVSESCFSIKPLEKESLEEAVKAANKILEEQYDVYVQRDVDYYKRLIAETASEMGEVLVIEKGENVAGILAYGKDRQAEVKEFLLMKQYEMQRTEICNQIFGENGWKEEAMRMMIRITDLQSMDGMLKGGQKLWTVQVEDSFVEENNGIWQLEWNQQGGSVIKLDDLPKETRAEVVDIARLTEMITENWKVYIQEWV